MKKALIPLGLAVLLVGALPATAQRGRYVPDHQIRIYGGVFEPDGDSQYWNDKQLDFSADAATFDDFTLGIDYARHLQGRLRLMFGGSGYSADVDQFYLDFVDTNGQTILHTTSLDIQRATAAIAFDLLPRRAPLVPYVGVGGGLYIWELTEEGDFIDFLADPLEVFPARFQDEGEAFGWFFVAGVDVPISSGFSIFGQARWHDADNDLEGDFATLGDLDLGGAEATIGFAWSF